MATKNTDIIENAPYIARSYYGEDHPHENGSVLGFWLYLMSDCLLFAALFATYAVIGRNYAGGPTAASLFELPLVALNTGVLLLSSLTFGISVLALQKERLPQAIVWLVVTGLLGVSFISLELYEFVHLVNSGAGPQRSGFLTAFFALVGTHGLHVLFGLLWLVTLIVQLKTHGNTLENQRRIACLSLFWHFLDIIWIGVFSFVYLLGALP